LLNALLCIQRYLYYLYNQSRKRNMSKEKKISHILRTNSNDIARDIVENQYRRNPEWKEYGERGKATSIRDAEYHLPFLAEAIASRNPEIFTDYIEWTYRLFVNLNLPDNALKDFLEESQKVIGNYLDDDSQKIVNQYIDKGFDALKAEVKTTPSYINDKNPYQKLLRNYNEALLKGDRRIASQLIMEAVESGVQVKDIYLYVFQPSQYEVGRLWMENKISVAKEHFASAATQQIMSQLYPHIFSSARIGKTMVAASVGGELHEIGIRMVADFFEMEGWDTYYMGANTPADSIESAIRENNADLLALSAAMPYHRSVLKEVIEIIRKNMGDKAPKIMVGGNAIKNHQDGKSVFNADDYAKDAQEAIAIANKLVNGS